MQVNPECSRKYLKIGCVLQLLKSNLNTIGMKSIINMPSSGGILFTPVSVICCSFKDLAVMLVSDGFACCYIKWMWDDYFIHNVVKKKNPAVALVKPLRWSGLKLPGNWSDPEFQHVLLNTKSVFRRCK